MERELSAENADSGGAENAPSSTERDASATETGKPIRHGSRLVGPLPAAKGAQNYFLGELNDAASIAALSRIWPSLGSQRNSTKALLRSRSLPLASDAVRGALMFRTYYVAAASLALFASLSTAGVQYRRPLLKTFADAGFEQENLDSREEASVEKVTAMGAAVGLAAACYTTRSELWPELKSFGNRFLPPKKVPMGVGTICIFAGSFNAAGWFLGSVLGAKK